MFAVFSCGKNPHWEIETFNQYNVYGKNHLIVDSLLTNPQLYDKQIIFSLNLLNQGTNASSFSKLVELYNNQAYKEYKNRILYAISKNESIKKYSFLISEFDSGNYEIQEAAVLGLGETEKDTLGISDILLSYLYSNPNNKLSNDLFIALGKIGLPKILDTEKFLKFLDKYYLNNSDWEPAWLLWRQYSSIFDEALLRLFEYSIQDKESVFRTVFLIKALSESQISYPDVLFKGLQSNSKRIIIETLNYFGLDNHIYTPMAENICKFALHENYQVQITAIQILSKYNLENVISTLEILTKDMNPYVKAEAVKSLLQIAPERIMIEETLSNTNNYLLEKYISEYINKNGLSDRLDFLFEYYPNADLKSKPWMLYTFYSLDSLNYIDFVIQQLNQNDFLVQYAVLDIILSTSLVEDAVKERLISEFKPSNKEVEAYRNEILNRRFNAEINSDTLSSNKYYTGPIEYKRAILYTTKGHIEIFFNQEAYNGVKNFIYLAQSGFYNKIRFHRVLPNWVVQTGDPHGDGYGGPEYSINTENSMTGFKEFYVGYANSGKNSDGSQFFINLIPAPRLNGKYSVFAKVIAGSGIAEKLNPYVKILEIRLLK